MSNDTTGRTSPLDHRSGEWRPPRGRMGLRLAIVLIVVILVAGLVLASVALGRSSSSSRSTINVTGSGTVQGTPDTMSFQVGVQTVAASAASALAQNNARVLLLEKALLGNGVTKKDMQTSGLNIYQNTNNSGQVTGFSVVDTLSVTTHKLKMAGAAIDAAAHAAGNGIQLYGVSFSISNESTLLASARAK
ncbi:MAG TPA: SIMPL domain-containing protein, partial [Acidimicrobiales bacterium]